MDCSTNITAQARHSGHNTTISVRLRPICPLKRRFYYKLYILEEHSLQVLAHLQAL